MKPSYYNRELSWLRFNERVLWEAERESLPLLDRVKFLAISAANLDEFFMVRVGGLRTLQKVGSRTRDLTGLTPGQELKQVRAAVLEQVANQYRIWGTLLEPALGAEGIRIRRMDQLSDEAKESLRMYFIEHLESFLNPVAVDLKEPNFRIPGRKVCLLLHVGPKGGKGDDLRHVVLSIPNGVPRYIEVPDEESEDLVTVEELIQAFASELFPGETIHASGFFRLTRNGDIAVTEDYAFDLAEAMEHVLTARKFSDTVRLEIPNGTPNALVASMQSLSDGDAQSVYRVSGMLDLSGLLALVGLPGYENLRESLWKVQPLVTATRTDSIFELLDDQDLLLHHPYESFDPVVRLVEEAADDPNVLAIKQVLYRTASDSRIISALIRAARKGKNVVVLIELKARFDEARNLERADELELAGAQLIYGIKGLKSHAKACMVVRREAGRVRRYMHFGTGNYNESTAKLYTDVSYLTSKVDYGSDASTFFNAVVGRSQMLGLRKLLPAPTDLKKRLLRLIAVEIEQAALGETAKIVAKMNSLQDKEMIDALYRASQAGVEIQLMVRGICCLRAGVPGLSDRIVVHSIIDRYLEHSRIFHFHHGGDNCVFISSADWMTRNLEKRIELMVPVEDPACKTKLISILEVQFRDNVQAWYLKDDGSYGAAINSDQARFRSQEFFAKDVARQVREQKEQLQGVLELHVPPKAKAQ